MTKEEALLLMEALCRVMVSVAERTGDKELGAAGTCIYAVGGAYKAGEIQGLMEHIGLFAERNLPARDAGS